MSCGEGSVQGAGHPVGPSVLRPVGRVLYELPHCIPDIPFEDFEDMDVVSERNRRTPNELRTPDRRHTRLGLLLEPLTCLGACTRLQMSSDLVVDSR